MTQQHITGAPHTDLAHDSAGKHVTGWADYTDDIAQPDRGIAAAGGADTGCEFRQRRSDGDDGQSDNLVRHTPALGNTNG